MAIWLFRYHRRWTIRWNVKEHQSHLYLYYLTYKRLIYRSIRIRFKSYSMSWWTIFPSDCQSVVNHDLRNSNFHPIKLRNKQIVSADLVNWVPFQHFWINEIRSIILNVVNWISFLKLRIVNWGLYKNLAYFFTFHLNLMYAFNWITLNASIKYKCLNWKWKTNHLASHKLIHIYLLYDLRSPKISPIISWKYRTWYHRCILRLNSWKISFYTCKLSKLNIFHASIVKCNKSCKLVKLHSYYISYWLFDKTSSFV